MTDQKHPLTDDLCKQIWEDKYEDNCLMWQITQRVIRAAYDLGRDDQFKEAIAWVEGEFHWGEEYAETMRKQLRPTETQENNK